MPRTTYDIRINRPAAEVFSYISDLENAPHWESQVAEAHMSGPVNKGVRGIQVWKSLGRHAAVNVEVVQFEPVRQFTVRGVGGDLQFLAGFQFIPADRATDVHLDLDVHPRGLRRLLWPFTGRVLYKTTRSNFRKLKLLLEGEQGLVKTG